MISLRYFGLFVCVFSSVGFVTTPVIEWKLVASDACVWMKECLIVLALKHRLESE